MANPKFFTEPLGKNRRILLTGQGDDKQYERLDSKYLEAFTAYNYKSHACCEASMATVLKTLIYFKTGDVPDISIADIINHLMDKQYKNNPIITKNDIGMFDGPFIGALNTLKSFCSPTDLYSYTEPMPKWGFNANHIIPTSKWPELMDEAKESVLDTGDFLFAKILKYGAEKGSATHMVLFSSLDADNNPLIIDPWGPYKQGDVGVKILTDFVEKSSTKIAVFAPNQYGFLALAGTPATF
ncbi:MAG: hypothetical protein WAV51_01080 [Microgenomates group bacterium]